VAKLSLALLYSSSHRTACDRSPMATTTALPYFCIFVALLGCRISATKCITERCDKEEEESVALIQTKMERDPAFADVSYAMMAQRDLAFVHVPMNFGNSVTEQAALGSGSGLSWGEVTAAGTKGWDYVNSIAQERPSFWGPMNPDLQKKSNWNGKGFLSTNDGCPLYYTPQQHWPEDLAKSYFGNRTIFGNLRDPYDRFLAMLRGMIGGTVQGLQNSTAEECGEDFSEKIKTILPQFASLPTALRCQIQEQAPFFEGSHKITEILDLAQFPANAQQVLDEHGYDNVKLEPWEMHHVAGCDNTCDYDLDEDAKTLMQQFYARDFALIKSVFGHENNGGTACTCCKGVPGMCPPKEYAWDTSMEMSVRRK